MTGSVWPQAVPVVEPPRFAPPARFKPLAPPMFRPEPAVPLLLVEPLLVLPVFLVSEPLSPAAEHASATGTTVRVKARAQKKRWDNTGLLV